MLLLAAVVNSGKGVVVVVVVVVVVGVVVVVVAVVVVVVVVAATVQTAANSVELFNRLWPSTSFLEALPGLSSTVRSGPLLCAMCSN